MPEVKLPREGDWITVDGTEDKISATQNGKVYFGYDNGCLVQEAEMEHLTEKEEGGTWEVSSDLVTSIDVRSLMVIMRKKITGTLQ